MCKLMFLVILHKRHLYNTSPDEGLDIRQCPAGPGEEQLTEPILRRLRQLVAGEVANRSRAGPPVHQCNVGQLVQ